MALLVSLTIPIGEARSIGSHGAKALMVDERQLVKNTLATAFGEGAVRPWRLVGDDGDFFLVAGWMQPRIDARRLERMSASIGATAHVQEFRPRTGQTLLLDVHASPQRNTTVYDGRGGSRNRAIDVAEAPGYGSVREAYSDWLEGHLLAPRTGLSLLGLPVIRSTRPSQGVYRNPRPGGDRFVMTRVPQVEARVPAKVMDANQFEQYLYTGLGPMRYAGYGCLFAEAQPDA